MGQTHATPRVLATRGVASCVNDVPSYYGVTTLHCAPL